MNRLLRLPSIYLVLPMVLACVLTLYSFDMPDAYLQGLSLLAATSLGVLLIDLLFGARLPPLASFRHHRYAGTREAFVALAYAVAVGFFCLLDLAPKGEARNTREPWTVLAPRADQRFCGRHGRTRKNDRSSSRQ